MSTNGIGALERGYRRTPQRETLALLAGALVLDDDQRRRFEAAAASGLVRRPAGSSVTVGPWPSAGTTHLPLALTSFVGRETELAEIGALIREHRLVTLTGAGGVGKTQTALHAARAVRDEAEHPICFVGLAPLHDPCLVSSAIASALGVQEIPNRSLLDTLLAYLKDRTLLLILDNCEHVIAEAALVSEALLNTCNGLRILATSREPLKAAGERAYRLPPLREEDAIAVFVDRAQAVEAHFKPTEKNVVLIGEICRRLDDIPLAIELAAGRVSVLSLEALAKRLERCIPVLTSGGRTASSRQQTMRAAIEWSFDLLSVQEQQVFDRLSVFAGGTTFETAIRVCAVTGVEKTFSS